MPMPLKQSMTLEKLGGIIRRQREAQKYTIATVSGHANVSPGFVEEVERGKETAEIGLVLRLLENLGLDLIVVPRSSRFTKEYVTLKRIMEGEQAPVTPLGELEALRPNLAV